MAERSSSFVSLLAAVVVAVTGLIPVIWILTSPAEESVVTGEGVATTTSSPAVSTVIVEPLPVLEVDELDPSVVRVLQAYGYAEFAGAPDMAGELPDAVARVLIEHDAVLTVVEPGPKGE